jgi:hypothetical protein
MIKVFVRHCNFSENSIDKKRPKFFSKEKCFENLLKTKKKETEVTIFFDGTVPQNSYLNQQDVKIISKLCGSDSSSFNNLLDYITSLSLSDNDIVYLLEDDYLHANHWDTILEEGLGISEIDYVTLYDHPDKYNYSTLAPNVGYDKLTSKIYITNNSHWRTIPSTTNTYAMRYSTLKKDLNIHKKYCSFGKITLDHAKFLEINNKEPKLISCIPGLSSHIVEEYMSPLTDWKQYSV